MNTMKISLVNRYDWNILDHLQVVEVLPIQCFWAINLAMFYGLTSASGSFMVVAADQWYWLIQRRNRWYRV